jgi:hypothetical protein
VAGVAAEVAVLSTKTRPKRLRFLGSDGQQHAFLLKVPWAAAAAAAEPCLCLRLACCWLCVILGTVVCAPACLPACMPALPAGHCC